MTTPYRDIDDEKHDQQRDSAAASDDGYSVITMSTASSASDAEKEALMARDKALTGETMLVRRQPPSRLARLARGGSRLLFVLLAAVGLLNLLSWSPPWGRHAPHHRTPHGPPPHGPFPGPPHVLDCFDLSDKHAAINFTITLPLPGAAVHLLPSLSSADVSIHRDDHSDSHTTEAGGPPPPPHGPPHGPHDGPHPPPPPPRGPPHGPPGGPHGPPRRPHGKPQTIMVKAKRVDKGDASRVFITSDDADKKNNTVHLCAVRLPFGQTGLGLFHEPPTRHEPGHDDKKQAASEEDEKKPKPKPEPHKFPDVSLEFDMPAGAPFTLTTGMPPHPPFHHGPPHRPHFPWGRHRHRHEHEHHHHKQHDKHVKHEHDHAPSAITKFMYRLGCAGRRQANAEPLA